MQWHVPIFQTNISNHIKHNIPKMKHGGDSIMLMERYTQTKLLEPPC